MSTRSHVTLFAKLTLAVVAALVLAATPGWAQVTLPVGPTPNFDNDGGGGDGQWVTNTNWDTDAIPTNTEDAKINDGLTAFYDADIGLGGAVAFGTLTIGVGSTFEYDPAGGSGTDFTDGNDIYFANNSQLTVQGFFNSAVDLKVPSASSAIIDHNGQSRYRGTLDGEGDLEVQLNNWFAPRWDAGSFTGDLTFTGSGYLRELGQFVPGAQQVLGAGNNIIGTGIYVDLRKSNGIPDAATVTLVGAGGGSYKFDMSNRTDTIANLVVDSPTGSVPVLRGSNTLNVSGTTTFQNIGGTGGTVEIDDSAGTPAGNTLVTGTMGITAGSGTWSLQGDGVVSVTTTLDVDDDLRIDGATITGTSAIDVDDLAELTLSGDVGSITADSLTLNSSGDLNFELGASGINAIDLTSAFTIGATSLLTIDGSSYTGAKGPILLVDAGSMSGGFSSGNYTVTGLGVEGLGWALSQNVGASGDLVLTLIPEPSSFALMLVGVAGLCLWRRRRER